MIVYTDIDDTMNEFSLTLAEAYKAESGIDALSAIRKHFFLEEAVGWRSEDVKSFFQRNEKKLFEQTPVKPYLRDMLKGLCQRNFTFHILTNRDFDYTEPTVNWIHDNELTSYFDMLHYAPGCKYDYLKQMNLPIDVIIEDRLDKVKPFLEARIPAILFNYEHNQGFEHRLLYRVNNWWDVYQVLCRLQIRSKAWLR